MQAAIKKGRSSGQGGSSRLRSSLSLSLAPPRGFAALLARSDCLTHRATQATFYPVDQRSLKECSVCKYVLSLEVPKERWQIPQPLRNGDTKRIIQVSTLRI